MLNVWRGGVSFSGDRGAAPGIPGLLCHLLLRYENYFKLSVLIFLNLSLKVTLFVSSIICDNHNKVPGGQSALTCILLTSSVYSCASKEDCVDKDNSESSSCHPFFPIWFGTAARQCTFCCHGDACNDEFKPTRDLFKTGAETKPDTAHWPASLIQQRHFVYFCLHCNFPEPRPTTSLLSFLWNLSS